MLSYVHKYIFLICSSELIVADGLKYREMSCRNQIFFFGIYSCYRKLLVENYKLIKGGSVVVEKSET